MEIIWDEAPFAAFSESCLVFRPPVRTIKNAGKI